MNRRKIEEFTHVLAGDAACTEEALKRFLPAQGASRVGNAMRYATLGGGKRLRAFLVMESSRMFGIDDTQSVWPAAAIECIHAYSLIHDDLPAMDDDDLRRGRPTVHKVWNDAVAVLAGDALQTLAFSILTNPGAAPDANVRIALIASLAEASGEKGMVGGQDFDLQAEDAEAPLTLDDITELQGMKTGALIRWSAEAGAVMAGEDPAPLRAYATNVGLAFQIHDDVLDVTGDATRTGKAVGKDEAAGKATFVSHLGVERARQMARALVDEAISALAPYGESGDMLARAAHYMIAREH